MLFRSAYTVPPLLLGPARTQVWVRRAHWIGQLLTEPTAKTALLILLAIDLVLIAIHALISGGQYLGTITEERAVSLLYLLSVTRDASVPEYFNHVKEALMLGALVLIWIRSRRMIYIIWSVVMLLILGDDSLRIHENLGGWIIASFPGLLGASDGWAFDEMFAWAIYAMVTVGLLWHGHRHSSEEERTHSWAILAGVVLVSCFAVGVDAMHSMVVAIGTPIHSRLVNGLFGLLEDGGEMLMLSLTCAIVLAIYQRCRRSADVDPAA